MDTNGLLDEFYYKVLKKEFVGKSFNDIVYKKLTLDGYVYCNEGLFPASKEIILGCLPSSSPFSVLLQGTNSKNYKDLYDKFSQINLPTTYELSLAEEQAILYALCKATPANISLSCLFILALNFYHNSPNNLEYIQYDNFIQHKNIIVYEVKSLPDFIAYLSNPPENTNYFYRGHSNINYIATPSLFREARLYKNEYLMYQEIVVRCANAFLSCSSHLDFLVKMQHYGLPTRLLDVTENPLVALYFACETQNNSGEVIIYSVKNENVKYEKNDQVAVLCALPMFTYKKQIELFKSLSKNKFFHTQIYAELKQEVCSERPFITSILPDSIKTPVFVKPIRTNLRISHQSGAFIIWGLNDAYYSESCVENHLPAQYRLADKDNSKKVVLMVPSKYKSKILSALDMISINKAFIYPEIDDVADFIKTNIR